MRQRQGRSGLRAGRLIGLGDGCNLAPVTKRPKIIDAKFDVVRGPGRIGQRHATRRGWYFTGKYDHNGDPLFVVWWLLLMEAVGGGLAVIFSVAAIGLASLIGIGVATALILAGAGEAYKALEPIASQLLTRD